MERWTFDSVFSGSMEKQGWKVAYLKAGIKRVHDRAEEAYARAIFDNVFDEAESALRKLITIREFAAAFDARPEMAEVHAYVDKLRKQQAKDELQKFLLRELGLDD